MCGKEPQMVNIVFCISESDLKRVEDEFSFNALTRIFEYEDHALFLESFLPYLTSEKGKNIQTKLQLKHRGNTVVLDLQRICYIEISKRIVEVHVTGEENSSYQAYARMYDLERCLNDLGFIRVHKSYLVAVNYINRICDSEIILSHGEIIHIGRTFKKSIKAICSEMLVKTTIN